MIVNPERYIQKFKSVGADILTVHLEACNHLHRTICEIKENDMKVGVAINPHTSVNSLENVIGDIDLVCLMSVNPGFGGQKFIDSVLNKITKVRSLIEKNNLNTRLEVDGGINLENISQIASAGADTFVAGSAIFNENDYSAVIKKMRSSLETI